MLEKPKPLDWLRKILPLLVSTYVFTMLSISPTIVDVVAMDVVAMDVCGLASSGLANMCLHASPSGITPLRDSFNNHRSCLTPCEKTTM